MYNSVPTHSHHHQQTNNDNTLVKWFHTNSNRPARTTHRPPVVITPTRTTVNTHPHKPSTRAPHNCTPSTEFEQPWPEAVGSAHRILFIACFTHRQDERSAKLEQLAKLEAAQQKLSAEFEQFKENDPQYFEHLSGYPTSMSPSRMQQIQFFLQHPHNRIYL